MGTQIGRKIPSCPLALGAGKGAGSVEMVVALVTSGFSGLRYLLNAISKGLLRYGCVFTKVVTHLVRVREL